MYHPGLFRKLVQLPNPGSEPPFHHDHAKGMGDLTSPGEVIPILSDGPPVETSREVVDEHQARCLNRFLLEIKYKSG